MCSFNIWPRLYDDRKRVRSPTIFTECREIRSLTVAPLCEPVDCPARAIRLYSILQSMLWMYRLSSRYWFLDVIMSIMLIRFASIENSRVLELNLSYVVNRKLPNQKFILLIRLGRFVRSS